MESILGNQLKANPTSNGIIVQKGVTHIPIPGWPKYDDQLWNARKNRLLIPRHRHVDDGISLILNTSISAHQTKTTDNFTLKVHRHPSSQWHRLLEGVSGGRRTL